MYKKGFYVSIILVSLIFLLVLSNGCEFSVTTANFKNVQVASEVNEETKQPITIADTFSTDAPYIYITGDVDNAPDGTKLKAVWNYLDMEPAYTIDQAEVITEDITTSFVFSLSKPTDGWPEGKYEVELYIDDKLEQTAKFVVE